MICSPWPLWVASFPIQFPMSAYIFQVENLKCKKLQRIIEGCLPSSVPLSSAGGWLSSITISTQQAPPRALSFKHSPWYYQEVHVLLPHEHTFPPLPEALFSSYFTMLPGPLPCIQLLHSSILALDYSVPSLPNLILCSHVSYFL